MNTQRRANGTARINKSAPDFWIEGRTKKDEAWTSFGRAKNSSFSKQIFFLWKIVLDLVGEWSLFFI